MSETKTLCMICGYELPIKNGGLHVQHSKEDCNANLKYKLQEARKRITELEAKLKAANDDAERLYGCINCIQGNPHEAIELHNIRIAGGENERHG